jgi:hypothetical protein
MSTTTLTETVVDIADHHTSLFYLQKNSPTGYSLPFADPNQYNKLHQDMYDKGRIDFSSLRQNYQPRILKSLSAGYDNYKYWRCLLLSDQAHNYPKRAWRDMLPITGKVIPQINLVKDAAFNFRVLPIPRIVLYPSGWSSWLSLRILGSHNLDQLASLLQKLFTTPAFQLANNTNAVSLQNVMTSLGDGVRSDAYGDDPSDVALPEPTLVTTVLAKHHGAYSVGDPQNEPLLSRIIAPSTGLSHKKFEEAVYRFAQHNNDPLEYMVVKDYSCFVWMEHRLIPSEINRQKLRCYHQNTFRLLVHARHLLALMNAAVKQKKKPVRLIELITSSIEFFEQPKFSNASFFVFLKDPTISKTVERAKKWSGASV